MKVHYHLIMLFTLVVFTTQGQDVATDLMSDMDMVGEKDSVIQVVDSSASETTTDLPIDTVTSKVEELADQDTISKIVDSTAVVKDTLEESKVLVATKVDSLDKAVDAFFEPEQNKDSIDQANMDAFFESEGSGETQPVGVDVNVQSGGRVEPEKSNVDQFFEPESSEESQSTGIDINIEGGTTAVEEVQTNVTETVTDTIDKTMDAFFESGDEQEETVKTEPAISQPEPSTERVQESSAQPASTARVSKGGKRIVLEHVLFYYKKSVIKDESKAYLKDLVDLLSSDESLRLKLTCHADDGGSHDFNHDLSESRSKAVINFLKRNGVSEGRIEKETHGNLVPVSQRGTNEAHQINRRVDIELITTNTHYDTYYKLPVKVHFVKNDAKTITEFSMKRLNLVSDFLKYFPDYKLIIVGFYDTSTESQDLSDSRALKVYNHLVDRDDMPKQRLEIRTEAYLREFAHVDEFEPGVKRRRVEFYLEKNQ